MKIKILAIVIIAIIVLENCRSDKYIPGICFQENILPIFISKCSTKGCHNSIDKEEGWDLTSYEGIMKGIVAGHPSRSKLYNVIKGKNPTMPPENHTKLTTHDVELIKSWIQFGAKNATNCTNACDTTSFKFADNVNPILNSWCIGCHSSSNPGGGVILTDYNGVQQVAANGKLEGSISHFAGYVAMPQNMAKLSECKIKIIKKWIDSGYPNN